MISTICAGILHAEASKVLVFWTFAPVFKTYAPFYECIMEPNHRIKNSVSEQWDFGFCWFILILTFCPEFYFLAFLNHEEKSPTSFNQIIILLCLPSGYTTSIDHKQNNHVACWAFNFGCVSTRFQKLCLDYENVSYAFF